MKKEWEKIGKLLIKIIINVLSCAISIWIAVNLFFIAFSIPLHLTIIQSISILLLVIALGYVFGIGDRSK